MKDSGLQDLLDLAIKSSGKTQVEATLKSLVEVPTDTGILTIVANAGIHSIPEIFLRGDVYEASLGDWNISSEQALILELKKILSRLVDKLRSRQWTRVYLIPTGHPILSIQIKAMVYRILRLNTVDLYYKNGLYFEVDLDQRSVALNGQESS